MATLVEIADPDDARIEMFRDIRERDVVGRSGFIAEGAVVLDQLLESPFFAPTSLLILRNRLAGLLPRLERLPPDVPVHVVERDVFDAIAGFPVHRGVMAYAQRIADARSPSLGELVARGGLVLVAAGIANHDNMGALFRNAAAFGVDAMLIDETSCNPLYRKAIRVSVGTALRVPFRRMGGSEMILEELEDVGFRCAALSPSARTSLGDWTPDGPCALFFGAEGPGLPASCLARMEGVRIEMEPGLDSLNVAHSAAIVLHHAYRHRRRS